MENLALMWTLPKPTAKTLELAEMLGISESSARKTIHEIKAVSDSLKYSGIIHRADYEKWLMASVGKPSVKNYIR